MREKKIVRSMSINGNVLTRCGLWLDELSPQHLSFLAERLPGTVTQNTNAAELHYAHCVKITTWSYDSVWLGRENVLLSTLYDVLRVHRWLGWQLSQAARSVTHNMSSGPSGSGLMGFGVKWHYVCPYADLSLGFLKDAQHLNFPARTHYTLKITWDSCAWTRSPQPCPVTACCSSRKPSPARSSVVIPNPDVEFHCRTKGSL